MRSFNSALGGLCICMTCVSSLAASGDGLRLAPHEEGAHWQTQLSVVTLPWTGDSLHPGQLQLGAARLASDRYFDIGRVGDGGGLRATSALLLGSRALALSAPVSYGHAAVQWRPSTSLTGPAEGGSSTDLGTATPYLGLGYSAWWNRLGLGLSADLGLLAQRPLPAGSLFNGTGSSLDNTVRAFQLSPVLQVNLSYAF
jgi:hypothetical protein